VLDRLTQACFTVACAAPGDNFRGYTYDDIGNRLTEVRDTGTTTYTLDAADQLTGTSGPSGSVTYGYDLDGRQISARSRTFGWNAMDRIASTTLGSTTTTYLYDGAGTRTQASTGTQASKKTNYDWDPSGALPQLVAERDGNAALLRRYRSGLDAVTLDTGGSPFYYHYDGLGSVVNLTSSTGVTQWTYDYLPFGGVRTETKNQNQAPTNVLRYTGELLDPTALYHLRARQYDSGTGRFLGVDPAARSIAAPNISTYAYVRNNPIRYTDPSGRETYGVCAAGQAAYVVYYGIQLCIVVTTDWEFGVTLTPARGYGTPAASGQWSGQVSNAESINDLGRVSTLSALRSARTTVWALRDSVAPAGVSNPSLGRISECSAQ
jgi:RHS repeat-associated protein